MPKSTAAPPGKKGRAGTLSRRRIRSSSTRVVSSVPPMHQESSLPRASESAGRHGSMSATGSASARGASATPRWIRASRALMPAEYASSTARAASGSCAAAASAALPIASSRASRSAGRSAAPWISARRPRALRRSQIIWASRSWAWAKPSPNQPSRSAAASTWGIPRASRRISTRAVSSGSRIVPEDRGSTAAASRSRSLRC